MRVKRPLFAMGVVLSCVVSWGNEAAAEVPQKLRDALHADSAKVRIVAVSAIAKSKDPSARSLLEPVLGDSDAAVRATAVDALGKLQDPGALAALARLKDDDDPTVKKTLERVLPALEGRRVVLDIGEVQDATNDQVPGMIGELQERVKAELEKELGTAVLVKKGGVAKGYGLIIGLRYIKKVKDGPNSLIEMKCEMTLVELPGKVLRLSSNATASAGVEGDIPKRMEGELARDSLNACAPSLAKDFADYARQRLGR